jgi:ribonucleoside-diphosphate reductase alpha chain
VSDVPFYGKPIEKEDAYNRFHRLLDANLMWPNTPCLINAGKPLGQLSACFVIPVEDSIEGIFNAMKEAAIIQKTGGGTGFSFSRLRPKNWPVDTTQGVASGPISFMRVFNSATGEMKQGGVRRGANMAVLRIDHPDIEEFITCKDVEGELSNFNISIAVTDEFMQCLYEGKPFMLRWAGKEIKEIEPTKLWDKISFQAWKNGEPGLLFIDQINRENPLHEIEEIEGCNPCGEQPLPPYGLCNLGSINLSTHVKDGWEDPDGRSEIDYVMLEQTVYDSVEFLDNMIEVNRYPLPALQKEALAKRRIGLGIMGLADMFLKMRVRYGSEESYMLAEKVMEFIDQAALQASIRLGEVRGVPEVIQGMSCEIHRTLRNGVITTIAPTGSVSILAGCSSGCEPVFAFDVDKSCIESSINMKHWFVEWYEGVYGEGTKLPPYAVEAGDVSPFDHINVQAALQKHVRSGISKTINCDNETDVSTVGEMFEHAYKTKCKSVTVYRDGSRTEQALTKKSSQPLPSVSQMLKDKLVPNDHLERSRPNILEGKTIKIKTGRGKLYLTVNEIEGKPFEVFLKIGKSGREDFAYSEAIGRLISLGLRAGIPVDIIVRHLENISGADQVFDYGRLMTSVPDAVAFFLKEQYLKGVTVVEDDCKVDVVCPDCGNVVSRESNCLLCQYCGWSKC